jgi:hypothetical protein
MFSFQAGIGSCALALSVKIAQTIDLMGTAILLKPRACTQSILVMIKIVLSDSGFDGAIYNITVAIADTYKSKNELALSI